MLSSSILDMLHLGVSADATHELHPVIKKELADYYWCKDCQRESVVRAWGLSVV
jgi:hypothetical protein